MVSPCEQWIYIPICSRILEDVWGLMVLWWFQSAHMKYGSKGFCRVMEQKVNLFRILSNDKLGQFPLKWKIIIINNNMTLNCKSLQNIHIFLAIFQYVSLMNYKSCQPDTIILGRKWELTKKLMIDLRANVVSKTKTKCSRCWKKS